ncbi:MAG: YWFCY domain-containing protein [Porphyromonas sp.]|nr:YWFCY domain-containing protein [Porphyromonas sp.]
MANSEIDKMVDFFRNLSFFLLLVHFFIWNHSLFVGWGLSHPIAEEILRRIFEPLGFYGSPLISKLYIGVMVAVTCLGSSGKKSIEVDLKKALAILFFGFLVFILSVMIVNLYPIAYIAISIFSFFCIYYGGILLSRYIGYKQNVDDPFNDENESFMQNTKYMANEYSVNLRTKFYYNKKYHNGWINIINPFRATSVLGTPGSGKSFAIVNEFIRQHIEKGFTMFIYDFKFPDLTEIAYNHYLVYQKNYENVKIKVSPTKKQKGKIPNFYIINFDDLSKTHRCNPLHASFLEDISDAYESAYVIMVNLNKTWTEKQGEFFTESAIIFTSACIWFLKLYKDGRYCSLPHLLELISTPYEKLFPILISYSELTTYMRPFIGAWEGGAQDQLQGQIASAQLGIARITSPALYWVMSGNDFSLDINDPDDPKILCVGNNPLRQNIYAAALGLINFRLVARINRKWKQKCSVIIDELPTIYFRGIDNLIATARSNLISICLGFQDYTQIIRDYGDKQAKAIINTIGNLFSGQVTGDTAEALSKRFGQSVQAQQSTSISDSGTSVSLSTQMHSLIPSSKISSLSQGEFVGAVVDNFDERISVKTFNAQIVVDTEKIKKDTKNWQPIPTLADMTDNEGIDHLDEIVQDNYLQIKSDVAQIIEDETARLAADPMLRGLLVNKNQ